MERNQHYVLQFYNFTMLIIINSISLILNLNIQIIFIIIFKIVLIFQYKIYYKQYDGMKQYEQYILQCHINCLLRSSNEPHIDFGKVTSGTRYNTTTTISAITHLDAMDIDKTTTMVITQEKQASLKSPHPPGDELNAFGGGRTLEQQKPHLCIDHFYSSAPCAYFSL